MSKHVLNTRLQPAASQEEARMRGATVEGEPLTPDDRNHWNDGHCLDELYRSEGPKLVRILARQTSNREEARDLVQDVFFRFTRMGGQWPAALERPQAYLRRIANNLLKDRAKANRRNSAALHIAADEKELPGFDPQPLLESRDMLTRLEAAMMRLRPRTREIFMAHRVHGESYAEIAERKGMTVKAVEKQMARALAQLDRILHRP